jgi:hypothetical protein
MNAEITSNLTNLLNINLKVIKNTSIEKMFNELINDYSKVFDVNQGVITTSYNIKEIKSFKKAKKNTELISAFENAKKMEFDEKKIIAELKTDILNSFPELKNKIDSENKGFKNQIIFLEYDYEPYAYFCGFGKGNYPILKKPEYFEFNFREELYAGIGKVDYCKIWKNLTSLNEILEDLDIYDQVYETELYKSLQNSVKFKTYLLLNKAFDEIGIKAFDGIEIEKPLMIYGNEHDCESINIYAYE